MRGSAGEDSSRSAPGSLRRGSEQRPTGVRESGAWPGAGRLGRPSAGRRRVGPGSPAQAALPDLVSWGGRRGGCFAMRLR